MRAVAAVLGAIGVSAFWLVGPDPQPPIDILLEDRKLATLPEDFRVTRFPWVTFSDDGRSVAYVAVEQGSHSLFRNGERVAREVGDFALSRDGRRLAYVASRMDLLRRRYRVIVDGAPGPEFEQVYGLRFGRDSRRIGYIGVGDGKHSVIVDGAVVGVHEQARELLLGSAGGAVAYTVTEGNKSFVVVDGHRMRAYESITDANISDDGSQVVYGACEKERCFVVAGEQHGPQFRWVGLIGLSSDGRRVGYWAARRDGEGFVVVGDREDEPIQNPTAWGAPRFSSDGQRYWYASRTDKRGMFVVTDGVRGPPFTEVGSAAFSPDSRQLAYPAQTADGKWSLVLGDRRSSPADFIVDVTFSRDGRHVGYGALIGKELWWKVMDAAGAGSAAPAARATLPVAFNEQTVRARLVGDFQGNVYGVASAGGLVAAKSLGADTGVFVLDAVTGEPRGRYPDGLPIALSADGRFLAIAERGVLTVWRTADGARVSTVRTDASGGVAFAHGSERLVAWTEDGEVAWWNINTGASVEAAGIIERPDPTRLVSPDGRLEVRIGAYDKTTARCPLAFVDRRTGTTLGVVSPIEDIIAAAAFSADGQSLVLGRLDGRVYLVALPPYSA